MKFVVARMTAEDRWASDGRRAARADVEQGGLTTRDAGRAAPERGRQSVARAAAQGRALTTRAQVAIAGAQGCRVAGWRGRDVPRWDARHATRAAEASAARTAEGALAAKAERAQATTRAGKVEAGVAAAARAREAAGQAEERAPEKGTARRLRGMARGGWMGRNGRGEGRNVEGRDGRRTGMRGGRCGRGRAGGGVENVR